MAKDEKRPYWLADDDDGRTIVDMSGLEHKNLLFPRRPLRDEEEVPGEAYEAAEEAAPKRRGRRKNRVVEEDGLIMDEAEAAGYRPWEQSSDGLDKKELRSFILGATAAGLLLVTIFIAAGGLLIKFLIWIWT